MKTTVFFAVLLFSAATTSAQINPQTPWIWMKGDNNINQTGVYGTRGMPASPNKPGARNFSTTWRDAAGNLWLFGGSGYGTSGIGYLNDLWEFDPSSNKWTWMNGDNATGRFSVYGTKGTASSNNTPGATFGGISWTGADQNLWLFGGFGFTNTAFGFLNSLWKYNLTANEWTWIKGDSLIDKTGNYGTMGIENATNNPGARYGSQTWTDTSGNLWLFGGYGCAETNSGILNDIWKYNPATNKWTWVNGDKTTENTGVYGTKGVPNAANKPGARYLSSSWTDHNGNLWLFGGYGYDANNSGMLNDLWKYNPVTNQWTWVNGDKTIEQYGEYGTKGVADTANKPGARYVCNSWIDAFGELWLFGGYGNDATSAGYLNDLWKYSPSCNKWTWVKGDKIVDQVGVYGIQGMPDTLNKSGARTGSVSWSDALGNLWMFGGNGFDGNTSGILNDLWKISSFASQLPVHLYIFSGVLNHETVRLQWQADMGTGFSHFNIQRSFDGINFRNIGKVNGGVNDNDNDYDFADYDLQNQDAQKVFYRLQMMDKNGYFNYSKVLLFGLNQKTTAVTVYPNPAVHTLNLSFDQDKAGLAIITITDMKGDRLKNQSENLPAGRISLSIDVSDLPPSVYILSVVNGTGTAMQQKFIKQ